MPHRYLYTDQNGLTQNKLLLFSAVRQKLREGYSRADFRADFMASIVVCMVAVPLGMALAIASGVPPQHGLYTIIVAGALVALLGGSRFQVTGPTAAFVVILAPVAAKYGIGGLLFAGMMAGFMLLVMGLARMGRLIQFIPYPVTTGFTSGIAVVIGTLQIKDFFGLQITEMPERYLGKVAVLFHALHSFSLFEFAIGLFTLLFLLLWPRFNRKIPAPLIALVLAAVLAQVLNHFLPEANIITLGKRFVFEINGVKGNGIPQTLPRLAFPWSWPGADGKPFILSFEMIRALIPSAFAIAMLGAIESLLSAVVADGLAQTKHDPDAELTALGIGNMVCPFFGGIAATGAIARTATNIRFGARSPFSSVMHALLVLLVILILAPWVSYLPMASLAALLLVVAYNMSEVKHFYHILRVAPRSDVAVLLACFGLTVIFDMVAGVTVGIVLAALLFMRRMATITSSTIFAEGIHPQAKIEIPKQVALYEIAGPLFFGAAEKAVDTLTALREHVTAVILSMENVPVMDMTGLVALESSVTRLVKSGRKVYLSGVKKQPLSLINKSNAFNDKVAVKVVANINEALADFPPRI